MCGEHEWLCEGICYEKQSNMSSSNNWDLGCGLNLQQSNSTPCPELKWNLHTLMLKLPVWCCLTITSRFLFLNHVHYPHPQSHLVHIYRYLIMLQTHFMFFKGDFGIWPQGIITPLQLVRWFLFKLQCHRTCVHMCMWMCVCVLHDVQEGTSVSGTSGSRNISWHFS